MRVGLGHLAGMGDCYDDEGNYLSSGCDATPIPIVSDPAPIVVTGTNLCTGMSDAQCTAYLNAVGNAGVATSPTSPPATGPGSITSPLTQAAAAIISKFANSPPVWVTNPTTGQSVLYNPTTGSYTAPAGQGITNPTITSLTQYIPLLLVAGVAAMVLGGRH